MRLGPHSRASAFTKLDTRSDEGRLYFETVDALTAEVTAEVGGKPGAMARELIHDAAMQRLHMSLFDRDSLKRGVMSPRNRASYLAFVNSHRLTISKLHEIAGKGSAKPVRSLADYLANKRSTDAAA